MPKEFSRVSRVNTLIRKELSTLMHKELKDPRLGLVTISDVDVSPDMKQAKIFVTALGMKEDPKHLIEQLSGAAKFLRREMGRILKMRSTPKLVFVYDHSIAHGSRLSALINDAIHKDQKI